MNFLGMGPMELMVILVLALIIFGPGKLPEIAGQVGRVVRDFRRTTAELSSEFNRTLSLEIEERKATPAPPAPPAPVAEQAPAGYEAYSGPVAETIAPPAAVEPSEAPAVVAPPVSVATSSAVVEAPVAETASPAAPATSDAPGASKRRSFDADLAPPY